jgi:hypothetical protein
VPAAAKRARPPFSNGRAQNNKLSTPLGFFFLGVGAESEWGADAQKSVALSANFTARSKIRPPTRKWEKKCERPFSAASPPEQRHYADGSEFPWSSSAADGVRKNGGKILPKIRRWALIFANC